MKDLKDILAPLEHGGGGDGGLWLSQAEPGLEGDRKQNPVLNEPHGLFYAQSCLLS